VSLFLILHFYLYIFLIVSFAFSFVVVLFSFFNKRSLTFVFFRTRCVAKENIVLVEKDRTLREWYTACMYTVVYLSLNIFLFFLHLMQQHRVLK